MGEKCQCLVMRRLDLSDSRKPDAWNEWVCNRPAKSFVIAENIIAGDLPVLIALCGVHKRSRRIYVKRSSPYRRSKVSRFVIDSPCVQPITKSEYNMRRALL